jgi:hypothetical protein
MNPDRIRRWRQRKTSNPHSEWQAVQAAYREIRQRCETVSTIEGRTIVYVEKVTFLADRVQHRYFRAQLVG